MHALVQLSSDLLCLMGCVKDAYACMMLISVSERELADTNAADTGRRLRLQQLLDIYCHHQFARHSQTSQLP